MTKTNSKVWLSWLTAGGLAGLLVAAGCGKNNWSAGAEAGAGGALGGHVGSVDASQADVPSTAGGGGTGSGGIGGSVVVDAPLATAGSVGTGGAGSSGLGGTAGASAGLGGTGGVGAITGGAGGGLVTGVDARTPDVPVGSGGTGAAGGGGSLSLGGVGGADVGDAGIGGSVAGGRDGGLGGGGGGGGTGRGGTLGTDAGMAGTGGIDAAGGNGGGGSTAKQDGGSASMDAAWWANDAGIKTCGTRMDTSYCEVGEPSICVVSGTYDTYQCSVGGYWRRQPDKCPGLLANGDTCTGQFTCLYPSYWYCDCSAGMGFPAKCSDIRNSGLFAPRVPGPGPTCPADMQSGCVFADQHYCVESNGVDVCWCQTDGTWTCPTVPCPSIVQNSAPCDQTIHTYPCQAPDYTMCLCIFNNTFNCRPRL